MPWSISGLGWCRFRWQRRPAGRALRRRPAPAPVPLRLLSHGRSSLTFSSFRFCVVCAQGVVERRQHLLPGAHHLLQAGVRLMLIFLVVARDARDALPAASRGGWTGTLLLYFGRGVRRQRAPTRLEAAARRPACLPHTALPSRCLPPSPSHPLPFPSSPCPLHVLRSLHRIVYDEDGHSEKIDLLTVRFTFFFFFSRLQLWLAAGSNLCLNRLWMPLIVFSAPSAVCCPAGLALARPARMCPSPFSPPPRPPLVAPPGTDAGAAAPP